MSPSLFDAMPSDMVDIVAIARLDSNLLIAGIHNEDIERFEELKPETNRDVLVHTLIKLKLYSHRTSEETSLINHL
jgi:hypothetical protein